MRVLIVDDDPELADLLIRTLARDGHRVDAVGSLALAHHHCDTQESDVIVLDLGLPDGDGLELCRALRARGSRTPILVLTASAAVAQRVAGLDDGADDFLAKPFAVLELRARVRALGRRHEQAVELIVTHQNVALDLGHRRAHRDDLEVDLTPKEWALIVALARRRGRVAERGELLEEAWGDDDGTAASSLEVLVSRIRRKLGGSLIRTVRGLGYALGDD